MDRKECYMGYSTVHVSFRMNTEVKSNLEQVCRELGLTPAAAFTLFATKVDRERRIPFDVAIDPFYSTQKRERLGKSIAQMEGAIYEVDD